MGKKAAMTMKMLVTIILIVIAIAIFLFVYTSINWTGTVDKEVCHQSVVYRATLPTFAGAKEYVPLKCKTQKICITAGLFGGGCDEFENSKGVTKVRVSDKTEIEKFIAREILDCWTTMGEGKLEIFGNWLAKTYGVGGVGSSCVICNRIAFDENRLNNAGIDLRELDVLTYMQTHAVPNKNISYYSYLAGEGGKISIKGGLEVTEISEAEKEEKIKEGLEKLGDAFENQISGAKDLEIVEEKEVVLTQKAEELAIMFTQISAPSEGEVLKNTLTTGLAFLGIGATYKSGAFISKKIITSTTPVKWAAAKFGVIARGSGVTSTASKTVLTPFVKIIAIAAVIGGLAQWGNVEHNRAVTAGYCGDISVGEDAREGCSVVRTINYNVEDISNFCSVIESIS